ncbi:MFS transporter [Qaidamihabitans albus]|uniref:MFS transporter n=1 Tax=Qaidamihabitans albus TaxID=2795733 RepID=UPI0018F200AF|nr:MFS transporter [Qaidamihabitans albus]
MTNRYSLGRYLTGAAFARTGDEMSGPALLVLGLAATGSVETGAALLTGLTISSALGGPALGALLDRSPRPGGWLAVALAGYAAGLCVLVVTTGRAATAPVLAVAALTGLLNPALSGGWTAQLPQVVRGARFARASGLDAVTFGAASLTGPALAGLLAAALGAPAAVLGSAVLVAAAVPVAWRLPARPPAGAKRGLLAGFRAIAASRSLLRATTATVVSYVGVGMLTVCCPLLGLRHFGDAGTGALLLSVLAGASLLANAALARKPSLLRPDATVLASTLVLGAAMLTAALVQTPASAIAAVALAGLGDGPQLTALFAIRHREAPEGARAQVFTTGTSLKITGFAAGTALAGPLAAWSVPGCLLVAAGTEGLAALAYLAVRSRRPSPARAA